MHTTSWAPVSPAVASQLNDARRQVHHAAQFATAMGISFLPPEADNSHTTLEWLVAHQALASHTVIASFGNVRMAVCIPELALLILEDDHVRQSFSLRGQTISAAKAWVRSRLDQLGLESARYSLERHFEIPEHAVASGAPFSADPEHLEQLARWFGNAARVLETVRNESDGALVRCWPHHFDIATLLTVHEGATVGVGMEPGDVYYDQPYFYVNASPHPKREALAATLDGGGQWHTHEWIGAVLPAARVSNDAAEQEQQVRAFLSSAIQACRSLVR